MMRILSLLLMVSPLVFASKTMLIPPYIALSALIIIVGLFFWGVYRAVKTQKTIYVLAMLPFVFLLVGMFFI